MALVPISDALRRNQEAVVDQLTSVRNHKVASKYMHVADSACRNNYERGVEATLLNNFSKISDSIAGPFAAGAGVPAPNGASFTNMSDFGPYVMEVWPLITAWYPDFPLKDLISVQSMDKPMAYLFCSVLQTGTSKSPTGLADVVETPLGRRKIRGNYPTGEVIGEQILDTQIDAVAGTILAYCPLNISAQTGNFERIKVTIDTDEYRALTIADGKVLFQDATQTAVADTDLYIEIKTGVLAGNLVFAKAGATGDVVIKANYVWDLDYATVDNIQKVKEQVTMVSMEAIPRAIALEWTIFSEYLKKSQFGVDIREDNTKRILNLVYQYQVRYILDDMYENAQGAFDGTPGGFATITIPTSNNLLSLEVQVNSVVRQLKAVATNIEATTGRMEGNRIVCSRNFKNWLEALPNTFFTPKAKDESAWLGPREIGEIAGFKVYYDPELEEWPAVGNVVDPLGRPGTMGGGYTAQPAPLGEGAPDVTASRYGNYLASSMGNDQIDAVGWMTYRGSEWYDAVYYLGEYMPIVPTDAVALAVTVRTSFVSMEAYRLDKPVGIQRLRFVFA